MRQIAKVHLTAHRERQPDRAGPPVETNAGQGDHSPPGRQGRRRKRHKFADPLAPPGEGPPKQKSQRTSFKLLHPPANDVPSATSASSEPNPHKISNPLDIGVVNASNRERLLYEQTWRSLFNRPYALVLFLDQLARRVPIWIATFIALGGWSEVHHFAVAQVGQTKFSATMQSDFANAVLIVSLLMLWKLAKRD